MTYLSINRGKTVQALLNDMISVEILNQLDDPIFEGMNDG